MSTPPVFRPFTLALIQLGQISSIKANNLNHARDMILKAAAGSGATKKPDVIVLPVCTLRMPPRIQDDLTIGALGPRRNASTLRTDMYTFLCMLRTSPINTEYRMTCLRARVKVGYFCLGSQTAYLPQASKCFPLLPRRRVHG